MKTLPALLISPIFVMSLSTQAGNTSCLQNAQTQVEINQCQGASFQAADDELNRVYQAIKQKYQDDADFLLALKSAQRAWIASRDADFALKFPQADKPATYGSAFAMCGSSYLTELTRQRTAFLQQWLDTPNEGDLCRGSQR